MNLQMTCLSNLDLDALIDQDCNVSHYKFLLHEGSEIL